MSLDAPRRSGDDLEDRIQQRPVRHTRLVYEGRVWDVRRDTVDLGPAGEVERDYVEHTGAVAVLALRQDRGLEEILMVQQYRHPVRALEWELPAGLLDVDGEPPHVAAARELAEEADLVAARWDVLVDYVSSPGGLSEALRIYLARDLADVPHDDRHEREGEEAGMPACWVPLAEAVEAVLAGRVRNATSVIGVLAARQLGARGWTGLRPVDAPWPAHPDGGPRDHA
jgi:8-oxo-dGTP pyrophosphatase MutT (NUDIX family)